MNTLHLIADIDGERLDVFLARQLPQHSRSFWQKQCEKGLVVSDGKERKSNHHLRTGQQLSVVMPSQPDFSQQELPILYEDDDVLVVNKPAGIITHAKGALSDEFSVAEFVRPRTTDGVQTNRPGIIHRLDRGTSGVIITAKNPDAKRWLQKQFSQRKVKKTYVALAQGHPKQAQAIIRLPILRNPRKPQTFMVNANGKPAETFYETLQSYPHATMLRLQPLTGRTHQLRVHLAHLGNPVIGDALYGKTDKQLERTFLHAYQLEVTMPNRERKTFTAPLPVELENYLAKISK